MLKKVGFIPLRKGSKGIKNKNFKKLLGRPLFSWVLTEAIFSNLDEVYIFTNEVHIKEFVEKEYNWSKKVKVLLRNNKNASDLATTESAMLEFCEMVNYDFDILCLLQATSPLTIANYINQSLYKLISEGYDSALSVVNTHRFIWSKEGKPLNYDIFDRPRRQDFDGQFVENGAVYVTKKRTFLDTKNRISGKVGLIEMKEESFFEVDSIADWVVVESLMLNYLKQQKKSFRISHLILDVDGVFTDGTVFYNKDGELAKQFNMRDGMGLEILRENGVEVFVITSEQSEIVAQRIKKLKIDNLYLGVKDKYALLSNILNEKSISRNCIAYVGDDINDLSNMCSVGWSLTPNNATQILKLHADIVLSKNSGEGAIREACEFILKYNKRYE